MVVQSVLFSKKHYTQAEAKAWLIKHKYKHNKFDVTANEIRARQKTPDKKKKFRTINFGRSGNIKAIIEF